MLFLIRIIPLFLLRLDVQTEYPKMQLIWQLFDGSRQNFPLDALTDVEKVNYVRSRIIMAMFSLFLNY